MTLPVLLGLFYVVIALIHIVWTIGAALRAHKLGRLLDWPIANRWVLTLYVLSLTCLFMDFARARFSVGLDFAGDRWRLIWVSFVLVTSLMAFWRWLSGSLLNYGDKK